MLAVVAGCDTDTTISADAAAVSLNGGVIFGSGHRSDNDTTSTSTSSTTESADTTTQTGRGGVIFGSGH
jgi:hypothetical protein